MVKIGEVLAGKYKLVEKLGTGGFATVYKVENLDLGVEQAVKVLHPQFADDPKVRERFRREVRTTMELVHPHIVQVREFAATDDGVVYYTMDFVKGRTLRGILEQEKIVDAPRALRLARQILLGLGAAHEVPIVHRDMKPENVIVSTERGREYARVLDFGIAKVVGQEAGNLTGSAIIGTVAYMAPEQADPKNSMDARADIYAVGITLYELLCGETPFKSESALGFLMQHQFDVPPALASKLPPDRQVSEAVEEICMRAIEKDPNARFQSCDEMVAAIDAVLGGPPTPARTGAAGPHTGRMTQPPGTPPSGQTGRSAALKLPPGTPPGGAHTGRVPGTTAAGAGPSSTRGGARTAAEDPRSARSRGATGAGAAGGAGTSAVSPAPVEGTPIEWAVPLAGQTAGKYKILALLGEGGFGAVCRAEDSYTGRQVALKLLRPELSGDPAFIERFRREARAIAALEHPNIPTLFEYGEIGGTCFMALALIPGEGLDRLIARDGPVSPEKAVAVFRQVLAALSAAHAQGIVHRDLKPSNIMVLPDGRAMVLDFGIAKLAETAQGGGLTRPGAVMGTPRYMSPEQARGRPLDARSDLYSLGVALFEALAGVPPFRASKTEDVLQQHINDAAPSLTDVRPDLAGKFPANLEVVIARALAKAPEYRFQSAAEMAGALEMAVPGSASAGGGAGATRTGVAKRGSGESKTKWDIAHVTEAHPRATGEWSMETTAAKGTRAAREEESGRGPPPPPPSRVGLYIGIFTLLLVLGLAAWLVKSGVLKGPGDGGGSGGGTTIAGNGGGTGSGGGGTSGSSGSGSTGTGGTGTSGTGGTGTSGAGGTGTSGTGGTGTSGTGGTGTSGTGGTVEPAKTAADFVKDGKAALREGDVAQAREAFEAALKLDRASTEARLGLVQALLAMGDPGTARTEAERLPSGSPERARAEAMVEKVAPTPLPEITDLAPPSGKHLAAREVRVSGKIRGPPAVRVLVNGTVADLTAGGSIFAAGLTLPPGETRVKVVAEDARDRKVEAALTLVIDITPPEVTFDEPKDGFSTKESEVLVRGRVVDDHPESVVVGGTNAKVGADGRFEQKVSSTREGSWRIAVDVYDRAGNLKQATIKGTRDTTPPEIEVSFPRGRGITRDRDVTVRGTVADGEPATVALGKEAPVAVPPEGGFALAWRLASEGENKATIVARDRASNEARKEVVCVLDTKPPAITIAGGKTIESPAREAEIKGTVDAGARVRVDGVEVTVRNGEFAHPVAAPDVPRTFDVVAEDEAGNLKTEKVTVVYLPPIPLAVAGVVRGEKRDDFQEYVSGKDPNASPMVFVPRTAKFAMGAAGGDADELPVHEVDVPAFYIDRCEVTWGQFRAFCAAKGRTLPKMPKWGFADEDPVVHVSREDAQAYAAWAGKRLPTEAEWELACRGPRAHRYAWGDEAPDDTRANFGEKKKRTTKVGSYKAGMSPFGCFDMAGNVAEWCADFYDARYYEASPPVNPKGPALSPNHTIRGGSWASAATNIRGADRDYGPPKYEDDATGFRCVLSE